MKKTNIYAWLEKTNVSIWLFDKPNMSVGLFEKSNITVWLLRKQKQLYDHWENKHIHKHQPVQRCSPLLEMGFSSDMAQNVIEF